MLWLGVINQCDVNPGRIAITPGQVVGTNTVVSWIKVTLSIARFIRPLMHSSPPPTALMKPIAHFYRGYL